MTLRFLSALLLAVLVGLAIPAHAQETTSAKQGISSDQDATTVAIRINQLQAQLAAVEKETLRRLQCQADTEVSTETGCREVPGLREHSELVLSKQTGQLQGKTGTGRWAQTNVSTCGSAAGIPGCTSGAPNGQVCPTPGAFCQLLTCSGNCSCPSGKPNMNTAIYTCN